MQKGTAFRRAAILIGIVLFLPSFFILVTLAHHSVEIAMSGLNISSPDGGEQTLLDAILRGAHANDVDNIGGYTEFAAIYTAVAIALTLVSGLYGYGLLVSAQGKTKTMDFIAQQVNDRDLIDMFSELRNVKRRYGETVSYETVYADYKRYQEMVSDHGELANRRHAYDLIVQVLNYYETWGIGIENQALNDKMLNEWWRSSLVRDFISLYGFILEYREKKEIRDTFENAEKLAIRWADKDELAMIRDTKRRYDASKAEGHEASLAIFRSLFGRRGFHKNTDAVPSRVDRAA